MFILNSSKLFHPSLASQMKPSTPNNNNESPLTGKSKDVSIGEHICTICKEGFSRLDTLKKHIKTSHPNSSHCAACGQDFQDRLALAKHQTEVRTYLI